jgi:hypothetical protein
MHPNDGLVLDDYAAVSGACAHMVEAAGLVVVYMSIDVVELDEEQ